MQMTRVPSRDMPARLSSWIDVCPTRLAPYPLIGQEAPEMQRLHPIDILARGQGCGKLAEACRETGVNGNARDGRISIQISQGLKDGLGITELGKDMHLMRRRQ